MVYQLLLIGVLNEISEGIKWLLWHWLVIWVHWGYLVFSILSCERVMEVKFERYEMFQFKRQKFLTN